MSGPVVLLVEDHEDTREMYALMLGASGFSVHEAPNPSDALALAHEHPPAVVVTDLRMSGAVTAATLCEHFRTQGVPVIAVTGVTPGAEQDLLREAGCAEILLKPLTPPDLVVAVQRVLGAHASYANQSSPNRSASASASEQR